METCTTCGKDCIPDGISTGYAIMEDKKICYTCAGKMDENELRTTGKLIGYLTESNCPIFCNWPGTFKVQAKYYKRSKNNFGAWRTDFWFIWEGRNYWGVNIGDNQIARVKLIKKAI